MIKLKLIMSNQVQIKIRHYKESMFFQLVQLILSINIDLVFKQFNVNTLDVKHLRVVKTKAILFLKSMSERDGSDMQRL